MIAPKVKEIVKKIKNLEIQGARNIAKSAIEAIIYQLKASKATKKSELYRELVEAAKFISSSRPTEPMMRNLISDAIRFSFMQIKTKPEMSIKDLKKVIEKEASTYVKKMENSKKLIAEYGSKIIKDGSDIITYCHSSTVIEILKKAKSKGKEFKVYALETRPRFQGRITAKELAENGINVTLAVDGAMNMLMKKADLCIVGADAITATGDLINKIGTSTLAHIARMHDVSFYSAAELYKFSPLTLFGYREEIEERDLSEVWENPPKKVKIINPAFDATAARYINGYITEFGILPPQSLWSVASQKLRVNLSYEDEVIE